MSALNQTLEPFRRQANAAFVQVLNQVRLGACTAETTAVLRNTSTNKVVKKTNARNEIPCQSDVRDAWRCCMPQLSKRCDT
jgi:hypothetical protein